MTTGRLPIVALAFAAVIAAVATVGPRPPAAGADEPPPAAHHDIELRLAPESGRLEAVDRIVVEGRDAVALDLAPGLEVRRVAVDGRPASVEEWDEGRWRIALDDPLRHEIRVEYGGSLAPAGHAEGPAWFGRPFLDAGGAFLPAGAGWIPDTGDPAVTFDLGIEVPEPYKAVATGRLVDEGPDDDGDDDGAYRAAFAADRPTEPPSVFVGPYTVAEREHGGVRLRTYFHDEEAYLAHVYLDQAARYLDLFQDRIGPYPYDAFHIVAAPLPVGLGFPGLTYVSRRILHLPFMQAGSLAHELLHNWWGNGVRVDYGRGNWAEGLTTFMADYALAEAEGPEEAREMRLAWLRDFAALPPERDAPLREFVAKGHDAAQVVGYNKAAFVFHMLRDILDPAAFDEGLRRSWREHRFGTASWDDLRRSFEAASGRDLSGFFDQWLNRSGAPRLYLERADARPAADGGGYEVAVTLRQDSPPYALSVPVAVETAAGTERRARVDLHGPTATATIRVLEPPRAVRVDPDHDLFRRLAPGEAPPIVRDVTLSPGAVAVLAVGGDEAAGRTARELAGRLMDAGVRFVSPEDPAIYGSPLLVIGLTPRVERALARAGLGGAPDAVAGRGTARAWVARREEGDEEGAPVLVVEADDATALGALLRPLPHYRRSSFLVFDGREVVAEGVWPPGESPLSRSFDGAGFVR